MKVKVQLRDTIKKIDLKKANSYEELKAIIRKSLKDLITNDNFFFYYYDEDNDRLQINDEQSFAQFIEEEAKPKMFIKLPDQDFQDQSVDKSNCSNILPNSMKQEKINTTVHRGINCYHCKNEIVGIRWKFLDQIDKDVCNKCKEKFHNKESDLLKIQTEDYLSKINYGPSIYRLFNPQLEKPSTHNQVKPWIKDQDIAQATLDTVKYIWQASAQLAREVASEFENWQKEYQRKAVKK